MHFGRVNEASVQYRPKVQPHLRNLHKCGHTNSVISVQKIISISIQIQFCDRNFISISNFSFSNNFYFNSKFSSVTTNSFQFLISV